MRHKREESSIYQMPGPIFGIATCFFFFKKMALHWNGVALQGLVMYWGNVWGIAWGSATRIASIGTTSGGPRRSPKEVKLEQWGWDQKEDLQMIFFGRKTFFITLVGAMFVSY